MAPWSRAALSRERPESVMPGMMGLGLTPTQMPAELGGWGKSKSQRQGERGGSGAGSALPDRGQRGELLVGLGEDPVVNLAGGGGGRNLGVAHLDGFVPEGDAEHGEQNIGVGGVGVVDNQDLAPSRDRVMGQRLECAADGFIGFGAPGVAAGFLSPVEGHEAGGDEEEQEGGSGGARARQQALAGGGQRLRGQQVPSGQGEVD